MAWRQGSRKRANDAASFDLRLRPQDRVGGPPKARGGGRRRTGTFRLFPKRKGRAGKGAGKGSGKGRSRVGRIIYWGAVLALWGVIAVVGLIVWVGIHLPPIQSLEIPKRPPSVLILGDNGATLATRGGIGGSSGGAAVPLRELPAYVPNAFIAIEDRRFYSHYAVDPLGIARAAFADILHHGAAQGGSTLTQQLAKNLFLTQERTVSRKLQEVLLAFWLEHKFSKQHILELYLNRVYFGAGAYGVEAASQRYFGKSARQLTLAEAAMLAGLVKSPSKLAPTRNPDGAVRRAQLVIADMRELNMISADAARDALAHPAQAKPPIGGGSANYVADWVMDAVNDLVGHVGTDLVIDTSIDPNLQNAAEQALVDTLTQRGAKFGIGQGALVAMIPDGTVRALIGGKNYGESQFDRAIAAKRQPGSAFKPFVYLTALEHGMTPDTVREDAPISVHGWKPGDFEHHYLGPVTLTQALADSINTVAVRLVLEFDSGRRHPHRLPDGHRFAAAAECLDSARHIRYRSTNSCPPIAVRQWRLCRLAARHPAHPHRRRQGAVYARAAGAGPHRRRPLCGDDEPDDARNARLRHRARRQPARLAGSRQDRHQPGLSRRLVHRLHRAPRDRRLARQ